MEPFGQGILSCLGWSLRHCRSDLRHGRRAGVVPDGLGIEQVVEQIRLVVHPVAVDVAPALTDIPVVDLHPVLGRVHVAEIAEAQAVERVKLRALVGLHAGNVAAEGVEQHVGLADDGRDLVVPLLRVAGQTLGRNVAVGQVAVAVAGDRVALGAQGVGHGARVRARLRKGLVAELFLIIIADAVAERALIPGHGDGRARAAIGKVRVLVQEIIQQRHEVVAAVERLAVGVHVFARELAVFHQQARGKAVAAFVGLAVAVAVGHIFVVAHVVLR